MDHFIKYKQFKLLLAYTLLLVSGCAPSHVSTETGASSDASGAASPGVEAADPAVDEPPRPPQLLAPAPRVLAVKLPSPRKAASLRAVAYHFNAVVRAKPDRNAAIIGHVRRGREVAAADQVQGRGCPGRWYQLEAMGYICESDGFNVGVDPNGPPEQFQTEFVQLQRNLPYDYFVVEAENAPIYWRKPTAPDIEKALDGGDVRSLKQRAMPHHWMALDERQRVGAWQVQRSIRGHFLHRDDVRPLEYSRFASELLEEPEDLPMVFMLRDQAVEVKGDQSATIERYARFRPMRGSDAESQSLCSAHGFCVERNAAALVHYEPRPPDIADDEQWIHIDLSEQFLVAYEGDIPQMATLVATGKGDWATPTGLFDVDSKYVTKTMSADNDRDGHYFVDQVPWTMFYHGSLAIHGAYWHDDFGAVRSHGCVNVPPQAARYLFFWAKPQLPYGFHSRLGLKGPKVWVTE